MYLDVVPIAGTPDDPLVGGEGPPIEYAVRMKEFPQTALASGLVLRGALTALHVDRLADVVAAFHATAAVADGQTTFGSGEQAQALALANFSELAALRPDVEVTRRLDALEAWTRDEHFRRCTAFGDRRRSGSVRECHGDLHLGNIALIDDEITVFDCLEFNERMRWIDVMNEIAFTVMDLHHCGRPDLARRFLNRYIERTGDYAGVEVLRFYLVYRAMVRAKVACLRAGGPARANCGGAFGDEFRAYLGLAESFTVPAPPAIVITHGFAGCGKTTLSQALLERVDAVRVRSDVERKRLAGVPAEARTRSGVGRDLYTDEGTRRTYGTLSRFASFIVAGGWAALIDATFLSRWQRDLFRRLADALGATFVIVDIATDVATLRVRLKRRAREGHDASEADLGVLEHQLRAHEDLGPDETHVVIPYDGNRAPDDPECAHALRRVADRVDARP